MRLASTVADRHGFQGGPRSGWLEAVLAVAIAALFFLFPMSKTLVNIALGAVIVLCVATIRPRAAWESVCATPVLWFPLALYALILLHAPASPADTEQVLLHLRKYARFLYMVLVFLLLVHHARRQQIALHAFSAAMVVTVILAWVEQVAPQALRYLDASDTAVFGDHITQNVMLALFSVVAFGNCRQAGAAPARWFWGTITALTVVSITHLSTGRTGQVCLFVVWASYLVFEARGRRLAWGMSALLLAAVLAYVSSDTLRARFEQAVAEAANARSDPKSSVGHRIHNYTITPRLVAEKPLLGHGTAAYHTQICRFVDPPQWCPVFNWHPHNQFLFLAADHGLVGAGLYLAWVVGLYMVAWRSRASARNRVLLFCLASLCLVDSLINSPLFSSRESQFFAYMSALLVSMNVGRASDGETPAPASTGSPVPT